MQLTIRVPDEDGQKIATLARRMGLKKPDIARLAIKQFLEKYLTEEQSTPYEKVQHLLGSAESGIKDLGQRHRDYLIQRFKKT